MNLYEETKYILKKYNITANKKLGQNFLIDENAIEKIIEGATTCKNDLVIEIGPGLRNSYKTTIRNNRKSYMYRIRY
ncbi:MAG: rRNA adenine N-6-methyltransferase family protein [Clostridia bacterium]